MILEKSWGVMKTYVINQTCTVKMILIQAGRRTSIHHHKLRDDMWVILDDGLEVLVGEQVHKPKAGDEFIISAGTEHSIMAGETSGRVLEIDFGFSMEDDVTYAEGAESQDAPD